MRDNKPKPCPFCGRASIVKHREWANHTTKAFYVQCLQCHSVGLSRNTAPKAIAVWNRREEQDHPYNGPPGGLRA